MRALAGSSCGERIFPQGGIMKRHAILLLLPLVIACEEDPTSSDPDYDPVLPTAWAAAVTNPFFPLPVGASWTYEGETDEGTETVVIEILDETRNVNGVEATVFWDRVYLDGVLVEDTRDWFAQDADGNVWYLGEESYEMDGNDTLNAEGSWEWGVDGALPGIYMWADPAAHIGEDYRQEFYEGEAEDWGRVVAVGQSVTVPAGTFAGCVRTEDWNALEGGRAGSLENKYYCPDLGTVLETAEDESLELTEYAMP
jgi:hypothetical protein